MGPKKPLRPTMSEFQEEIQDKQSNGTKEDTKPKEPVSNPFSKKSEQVTSSYNPPQTQIKRPNQIIQNQEYSSETNQQKDKLEKEKDKGKFISSQSTKEKEKQLEKQTDNTFSSNQDQKEEKKKGNSYTFSETKQLHKRSSKLYKINPKVIPRPNHFDEIYKNAEELPLYSTDEGNLPPYTNTHYIVQETSNTTPRILRSTLMRLPTDSGILSSSNLMFGFVCQPFGELLTQENEIPKVEVPDGIFRCKRCEGYINNKFKIEFNKSSKRVAICNLCGFENELDTSNPKVKPEYITSSISVAELNMPTIDFIAPNNMKHNSPFEPSYLFFIDISTISCEAGVPAYVFFLIRF